MGKRALVYIKYLTHILRRKISEKITVKKKIFLFLKKSFKSKESLHFSGKDSMI